MKNGRYSIGEISRLCCVPISKLRYWDESGVIKPCFVDEESGYRYYDNETLLLISVLKYYQSCGFKLGKSKRYFSAWISTIWNNYSINTSLY